MTYQKLSNCRGYYKSKYLENMEENQQANWSGEYNVPGNNLLAFMGYSPALMIIKA